MALAFGWMIHVSLCPAVAGNARKFAGYHAGIHHAQELWQRVARHFDREEKISTLSSSASSSYETLAQLPSCEGKLLWSGSFLLGDDKCHELFHGSGIFVRGHCADGESTVYQYTDFECTSDERVRSARTDTCSQIIENEMLHDFKLACGANGSMTLSLYQAPLGYDEIAPLLVHIGSVMLYSRVFLPRCAKTQKVAAIYQQIPYKLENHEPLIIAPWAAYLTLPRLPIIGNMCIGLVLQETRGMDNSTGEFDFFRHGKEDAEATVEALKSQPWHNGVLLLRGISAMGIRAFLAAGATAPLLRAQSIGVASPSVYTPVVFDGGNVNTGILYSLLDSAGLTVEDVSQSISDHVARSSWWDGAEFTAYGKVRWPSVHLAGWFDIIGGVAHMNAFNRYREQGWDGVRKMHMLFIEPLGHCDLHGLPNNTMKLNASAATAVKGSWEFSTIIMFSLFKSATDNITNAFASTLFRAFTSMMPRIIVYMMGSAGNYLTTMEDFPEATPIYGYLAIEDEHRLLKFHTGLSNESVAVSYTYDPASPVPTRGGYLFQDEPNCGPMDQLPISTRPDVLTFIGEPLPEKLAIMGPLTARLAVGSSAEDTDFIVKLLDVYPGAKGPRYNVASGIVRMRWRHGGTLPMRMERGNIYHVDVDMKAIGWVFAAGHRIGVQIQSSSWPEYLPHSNTVEALSSTKLWPRDGQRNVTADNTIFVGGTLSFVTLPKVKLADVAQRDPPEFSVSAMMRMISADGGMFD
eukprot:TRINITY_DN1070_c0_g1_i1.p1 TRINITY_DN1070_c0_g1~~TRINITY_DN1070_c0_g1_i1.p1  ORF type:complete len:774 (+),score=86.39 TRINITY_DN1070_c0_g1_i1:84-2324(+)